MNDYIPPGVQRFADESEADLDHPVKVTRLDDRRWRVSTSTDRVSVSVDLKATGPGRFQEVNSTLVLDGERYNSTWKPKSLRKILADPDAAKEPREAPLGEPDPMPPAREVREAPVGVAQQYRIIEAQIPAAVQLGYDEQDKVWVVGLTSDRGALRIRYALRKGFWTLARRRPFQVVVDGRDVTSLAEGKLENAIALMAGKQGEATQAPPSVRRTAAPTRSSAVETRRANVIRV
ncbi:hypothetical protein E1091_05730 [Micromonospora fluostatini]|uniref:Uncharacterized protein n=1 Tax=Micromonospora fluostatini TaxID=1629071 RepID=A0ABY2DJ70_9ACTN|nr:hypothetical protein E1091_05730 [Micromonospora fluostatini]